MSSRLNYIHKYKGSPGITFPQEEGRTKQSFKEEVDINNIVDKYQRTGAISHANQYEAQYGDVTVDDFQTAMNVVANANTMYEDLPSTLREKFISPEGMLQFFETATPEDLREYGLVQGVITKEETIPTGMLVEPQESAQGDSDACEDEKSDE